MAPPALVYMAAAYTPAVSVVITAGDSVAHVTPQRCHNTYSNTAGTPRDDMRGGKIVFRGR